MAWSYNDLGVKELTDQMIRGAAAELHAELERREKPSGSGLTDHQKKSLEEVIRQQEQVIAGCERNIRLLREWEHDQTRCK